MSGTARSRPNTRLQGISSTGPASSGSGPEDTGTSSQGAQVELSGVNVALVRVAVELTDSEKRSLTRVLEKRCGCPVRLEVELDSRIIGGVWIQVGDTIIDGSLQGRLESLRHHLRVSSRAMILDLEQSRAPEGNTT